MRGTIKRIKKAMAFTLCLCVIFTSIEMPTYAYSESDFEDYESVNDISENVEIKDVSTNTDDEIVEASAEDEAAESEATKTDNDEIVSIEADCSDYVFFLGGDGVPKEEFRIDSDERYSSSEDDYALIKPVLENAISEWKYRVNVDNLNISFSSEEECAEQVKRWVSQVLNEHGEFFYCTGSLDISYNTTSKKLLYVYLNYSSLYRRDNVAVFYEKLEEAYNAAIKDDNWSDYNKALALHDWLTTHCSYVNTSEYDHYKVCYSPYGPIVEGIGVCMGYAYAYQALLKRAGIECLYVSSRSMNHGWNVIKLDGQWYHVDCTWDDPVLSSDEVYGDYKGVDVAGIGHTYFLRSDAGITSVKHYGWTVENDEQISCTSTKYDNSWVTSINSPIYYINGVYYFLNGTNSDTLSKRSSSTVTSLISGISKRTLAYDGNCLFFAIGNSVYKCTPGSSSKSLVYSYTSSGTIIGLRITGDNLRISISTGGTPKYKYIDISISSKTEITGVDLIVGDVDATIMTPTPIVIKAYVTKGAKAGSVSYEWFIYKSGNYEKVSGVTGDTFNFLPRNYVTKAGDYKIKVTASLNGKSVSDEISIYIGKSSATATYKKTWKDEITYGMDDIYTPVYSDFDTNLPSLNIFWSTSMFLNDLYKCKLEGAPSSSGIYYLIICYDEDDKYDSYFDVFRVIISRKTLSLTIENQTIEYGDSIDEKAYSLSGLVAGDTAIVSLKPSKTYPGKGTVKATVNISNSKGEDVTGMYSIEQNTATLTVNPKKVYITIKDQTIEQYGSVSSASENITVSGLDNSFSWNSLKLSASDNETIGNTGRVDLETITFVHNGATCPLSYFDLIVTPGKLTVETRRTPVMKKISEPFFENMTLGDVSVSSEYGTWEFVKPDTPITAVGTYSYEAVFTSNDTSLYAGGRSLLSVEITKGRLSVSKSPSVNTVTYSPEMTEGKITLENIDLIPGEIKDSKGNVVVCSYEWTYPSTKITSAGSHRENYTASSSNYYSKSSYFTFEVQKATPVIVISVDPITAGETLADAKYTATAHYGTEEGEEVPGQFKWLSPSTFPSNGGKYGIRFTPTDTTNYSSITKYVVITVKGDRAQLAEGKSVSCQSNTLNYGSALSSLKFTTTSAISFVRFSNKKSILGTLEWENPDYVPSLGTYNAKWVFTPLDTECEGTSGTIEITVKKCITITVRDYNLVYGEEYDITEQDYTVTGLRGSDRIVSYDVVNTNKSALTTNASIYMDNIVIENSEGEDVSSEYEITMNKGKLTVSKMDITVTVKNQEIEYGQAISSTADDVVVTGLPTNYEIFRIKLVADTSEIGSEGNISVSYITFTRKGEQSSLSTSYYNCTKSGGKLTISKAKIPEVSFDEEYYKGMKLSDFVFPSSKTGSWAWVSPATEITSLGKKTYDAVFTPVDTTRYQGGTVSIPFEVTKGTLTIKNTPYAGGEYSPNMARGEVLLSDFEIKGGKITDKKGNELEASMSWINPNLVIDKAQKYSQRIYISSKDERFSSLFVYIDVTVNKSTPYIARVFATNLKNGETLSKSDLSGEARYKDKNGEIIDGSFSWKYPDKIYSTAGTYSATWVFTPKDSSYLSVERNINITVKNDVEITVGDCEIEYGETIPAESSLITVTGLPAGYSITGFRVVTSTANATDNGSVSVTDVTVCDANGNQITNLGITINPGKLVIKKKKLVITANDYSLPKGTTKLSGPSYVEAEGLKNSSGNTIGVIRSIEYELSVNVNDNDNGSFVAKNVHIRPQNTYSDITANFDITYVAGKLIKPVAVDPGSGVSRHMEIKYAPGLKLSDIEIKNSTYDNGYWTWVNPNETIGNYQARYTAKMVFVVTDNYFVASGRQYNGYIYFDKAVPYISDISTIAVENGKKLSEYEITAMVLYNDENGAEMPGHFEWLYPDTVIEEENGQTGQYPATFIPDDTEAAETLDVDVTVKVTPVYYVTFNARGGSFEDGSSELTVKTDGDGRFVLPAAPVMYNRIFAGWYKEEECENELQENITEDSITLYAAWELKYTTKAVTAHFSDGRKTTGESVDKGTALFLSCEDEDARIYYTIGATFGDVSENEYSGALYINENTDIYAVARHEGFYDSEIICFSFAINDEEPWGDITQEDRERFENDPSNIPEGLWIAGVTDMEYTGTSVTFANIRVYDRNRLLVSNKDYRINYKNNKKVAASTSKNAPRITVTGMGNYSGKTTVTFSIVPFDIVSEEIEASDVTVTYTKKVIKPSVILTRNGKTLSSSDFYIESYRLVGTEEKVNLKEVGEYIAVIKGKGGYCGQREVRITVIENKLVSRLTFKNITEQKYTGGEVVLPKLQVYDGKKKLTLCSALEEEGDILVTYSDNVNVGTATVTFEGRGQYTGTLTKTFKIRGTVLSSKNVTFTDFSSSERYTSGEIKQSAKLYYNGELLIENRDYTVTYSKNISVGKATAVYRGIGIYEGSVKKNFRITAYALSKDDAAFSFSYDENVCFTKGGAKTGVEVWFEGMKLTEGKDYTVSYGNNKKLSTSLKPATVTITGKGCFLGKVTFNYIIGKKDLSEIASNITASSKNYSKKKGAWKSAPVIKDSDGKALKSGTDYYNIVYTYGKDTVLSNGTFRFEGEAVGANDIPAAGTIINVQVTGKGNYTGTISTDYRIAKETVYSSKASFKTTFVYTGSAVEPEKSQMQIKVGKTVLNDDDYDIISYSKNINAGTGYLVIKGKGNYTGTKTISFKIKTRSVTTFFTVFRMFTAMEGENDKTGNILTCRPYAA